MPKPQKKEKNNLTEEKENDPIVKKIIKMYENYGLDISNMSEEEFDRLKKSYKGGKSDLDHDLDQSKKHQGKFDDDVM